MTISLNDKVIKKSGVSLGEVLLMIAIQNNVDFNAAESELKKKGLISTSYDRETHLPVGLFVTSTGNNVVNNIILDSDKSVGTKEFIQRIEELVPKLQEIFPEGKKFGTNKYWRGSQRDIKEKLQSFFKKYGEEYTDEQIIEATKSYVQSFNGNYSYMRILQYFIWKGKTQDGESPVSELATIIENGSQSSDLSETWTSTLK